MDASFEETTEENLVLVEFAGNTGSDAMNQENLSLLKVLGIETEHPLIQIGNQLYHGKYYPTLGTDLFFQEIEGRQPSDSLFDSKIDLKLEYCGKTNTKLIISRTFARPINTTDGSVGIGQTTDSSSGDAC